MEKILQDFIKPTAGSWFITQTISPKLNIKPASYQFAVAINPFIKILDRYCYDYQYVTELTDQCNVHFHAWVVFKNDNNKFRFINDIKKTKELGFCKINVQPITEIERTASYMIDANDEKKGKNLKAAYALIQRTEVIGRYSALKLRNEYDDYANSGANSSANSSNLIDTSALNIAMTLNINAIILGGKKINI